MPIDGRSTAGAYAQARYIRGLRAWQAKTNRIVAVVFGPFMIAGVVELFVKHQEFSWLAGALTGAFAGAWLYMRGAPPAYIETWHDGAEGERQTAKRLVALERSGWHVVHDIQVHRGNYDHVVVGPPGVFLLETKNLLGTIEIRDGIPHLLRRLDPDADNAYGKIRPWALGAAAELNQSLRQRTGERTWVQAVVVFWADFPQDLVEDERCVFLHGTRLQAWLREQPNRLSGQATERLAAAVREIASSGDA